jgi:hypothetical protein
MEHEPIHINIEPAVRYFFASVYALAWVAGLFLIAYFAITLLNAQLSWGFGTGVAWYLKTKEYLR